MDVFALLFQQTTQAVTPLYDDSLPLDEKRLADGERNVAVLDPGLITWFSLTVLSLKTTEPDKISW